MNLQCERVATGGAPIIPQLWRCPYYDSEKIECRAATSNAYLSRKVSMRFCLGDNHDNCAVFLAKLLRGGSSSSKANRRSRRMTILDDK